MLTNDNMSKIRSFTKKFEVESSMAKETLVYGKRGWRYCLCNNVIIKPYRISHQKLQVRQMRIRRRWI